MQKQIHSLITTTLAANPTTNVFCFSDQELKGESGTTRAHAMGEVSAASVDTPTGNSSESALASGAAAIHTVHQQQKLPTWLGSHVAATTEQYCGNKSANNGWTWIDDKKVHDCLRVHACCSYNECVRPQQPRSNAPQARSCTAPCLFIHLPRSRPPPLQPFASPRPPLHTRNRWVA